MQDFVTRAKLGVQHMVQKVGFFGILACASVSRHFLCPVLTKTLCRIKSISARQYVFVFQIPNPLFDLAGITCGHFLVPFWTFFGATLIGKAIIKMHIQVGKPAKRFITDGFKSSKVAVCIKLTTLKVLINHAGTQNVVTAHLLFQVISSPH